MSADNPWDKDDLSTVVAKRYEPAVEPPPGFTVLALEGPDQGRSWQLDTAALNSVLIGKSVSCAIQLGDRQVSRRHAALEIVDGSGGASPRNRLRMRDLDSANGSFIDGVRIIEAFVTHGSVLRLGETTLRVDASTAPPPTQPSSATRFGKVLGASLAMRRIYPLAERFARSDIPIIIEGETGTGKEVLAESIHEASPRAAGPYVVFDCTTVAASLIESELFGHERGAFTGAVSQRRGVFEQAHRGTLFLDEIGDLPLALQAKLLRAIERAEVRRLGGEKSFVVDVRVIAATRRDLDREVQEGRFRDDLFHRLAVGRIELPPLARRTGDIPLLAGEFWRALSGTKGPPNDVLARWEEDRWPGNVRQLRNAVARQIALSDLPAAGEGDAAPVAEPAGTLVSSILERDLPLQLARMKLVAEFEQLYIARLLARHDGNTSEAAKAAGVALRYFNLLRSGARRK